MPEDYTYQILVYRVQDRLRDCWTAEWDTNTRYSSDGRSAKEALGHLLSFLAGVYSPCHGSPVPPVRDQPINQQLLEALKILANAMDPNTDPDRRGTYELLKIANDAIAKAEGR